jgi:hypothetical protein
MLKQIPKVLLLLALLATFLAGRAPAFRQGSVTCECYNPCLYGGGKNCKKPTGNCAFDAEASPLQCVDHNCSTYCVEIIM